MKENKNIERTLITMMIGFYLLLLLPILFAKDNPITNVESNIYQDNVFYAILYAFSSYFLISIPFIKKFPRWVNASFFVIGGWSVVSLIFEILNFKYPEQVLNNPYQFGNPIRLAFLTTTLVLISIYREKVWKPMRKKLESK